jgi:hypothetical protein
MSIGGRWVKIGAWSGHLASTSLSANYDGAAQDAVDRANDLDAPLAREHLTLAEVEADAIDAAARAAGHRPT